MINHSNQNLHCSINNNLQREPTLEPCLTRFAFRIVGHSTTCMNATKYRDCVMIYVTELWMETSYVVRYAIAEDMQP